MRQFTQEVASRYDNLPRLDENFAFDRDMDFGESGQPQVGAAATLAKAFAKANEALRSEAEAVATKQKHDIIALVGPYPQGVGAIVARLMVSLGTQVHNLALDRTAGGIGSEAVDLHNNPVRFSLQHALIDKVHVNNAAIDRAYDAQRYGRDSAPRITKDQHQYGEQGDRSNKANYAKVMIGNPAQQERSEQERNALMGNKRVTSTLQRSGIPAVKRLATIPRFCRRVNTFAP